MTISKKLFLLATLVVGSQANMSASQYLTRNDIIKQEIFKFALTLKQQDNADAKMASEFLENELLGNSNFYNDDKIIMILNAQLTLEEKVTYILALKTTQDEVIAQRKESQDEANKRYYEQQYTNRIKEYQDEANKRYYKQQYTNRIKETLTLGAVITAVATVLPCLATVSEEVGKHIGSKIVAALFTA